MTNTTSIITAPKIVQKKNLWFFLSFAAIAVGLATMVVRGLNHQPVLNFGIDFTGGSTYVLRFEALDNPQNKTNTTVFIASVRQVLKEFGLEKSQIQITENREVIVRTTQLASQGRAELMRRMTEKLGTIELLEADVIGPTVGNQLRSQSIWIILCVCIAIMLYVSWRFEFAYGFATLTCLVHDALVMLSFAAIFQIEVDMAFVAAILTVLGYSMNDTIIVFDRIRENYQLYGKDVPFLNLINVSIKQIFGRTINTSMTTLLVTFVLLLLGGATIKPFATMLFVGILVGTYSSIFTGSPLLALLHPAGKSVNIEHVSSSKNKGKTKS